MLAPLALERLDELVAGAAVLRELGDLAAQAVGQDVEIAHRPEQSGEPLELGGERLQRLAEQRTRRALDRAGAARGDPELVQVLGIRAEADARVVRLELL